MCLRQLSVVLSISFVLFTGCSRNQAQIVADARTAGRHLGRSVKALFGDLSESRLVSSADIFAGNDLSRQYEIVPGFEEIASQQSAEVLPVAMDLGAHGTPTIDQFSDPSSGELAKVFDKIPFETDSSQIQGGAQKTVQKIAQYLQEHPNILVAVEGHCDERGPALYNLSLGARRAHSVRTALVKAGVDPARVITVSYGKERPLVQGSGSDVWAKNRRAQFKISTHGAGE